MLSEHIWYNTELKLFLTITGLFCFFHVLQLRKPRPEQALTRSNATWMIMPGPVTYCLLFAALSVVELVRSTEFTAITGILVGAFLSFLITTTLIRIRILGGTAGTIAIVLLGHVMLPVAIWAILWYLHPEEITALFSQFFQHLNQLT